MGRGVRAWGEGAVPQPGTMFAQYGPGGLLPDGVGNAIKGHFCAIWEPGGVKWNTVLLHSIVLLSLSITSSNDTFWSE